MLPNARHVLETPLETLAPGGFDPKKNRTYTYIISPQTYIISPMTRGNRLSPQ
jgi:hypothetical protein